MVRALKDRPDVQVFAEIGAIDQLATVRIERVLPDGLTHAQFMVLNHLVLRGQAFTPAQLARTFQVTKGAMTNTVQRLSAAGLIAIEGDEHDGRKKQLTITQAGVAAHERCMTAVRPMIEGLRKVFSEGDFEKVLPFLQALRGWLGEAG
jgi:DNA-binding MarR family transcriptional regulator